MELNLTTPLLRGLSLARPRARPGARRLCSSRIRRGLTLVEMLVATVLTLMMMGAVSTLFERVGNGITASRALLEMSDRLRLASARLQSDLGGIQVKDSNVGLNPPYNPGEGQGYVELTEGPIGPVIAPEALFRDSLANLPDTSVLDNDDILMFTAHSEVPFVGRYCQPIRNPSTQQVVGFRQSTMKSHDAEIIYFVRGRTLYRRMLLIVPGLDLGDAMSDIPNLLQASFYAVNDISVRNVGGPNGKPVANSLSDLTKPEYRYAHRPVHANHLFGGGGNIFPFHPHFGARWDFLGGGSKSSSDPLMPQPPRVPRELTARSLQWRTLGLPTLRECSFYGSATNWWIPATDLPVWASFSPQPAASPSPFDLWENPNAWNQMDSWTGNLNDFMGIRVNEDVLLTNVIGFDVKVWDQNAPLVQVLEGGARTALAPGDPGYLAALYQVRNVNSQTVGPATYARAYNRGAYVDLNYMCSLGPLAAVTFSDPDYSLGPAPQFAGAGHWRSGMRGVEPFLKTNLPNPFNTAVSGGRNLIDSSTNWIHSNFNRASVYDTWATHYESDGLGQFPNNASNPLNTNEDTFNDGVDSYVYDPNVHADDSSLPNGTVDDDPERETQSPYTTALRAIRITIRVYEPGTHQIRQRTIEHSFVN